MKELQNWRALIEKEEGVFENALPLPGCLVEGEIDGIKTTILNAYFDFTNSTVEASNGDEEELQTYKLGQANREYMRILNQFIEYSKTMENNKNENEIGE